jgi:hypothetical protein
MPKMDLVNVCGFVLIGPIAVSITQSPLLPAQGEEDAAYVLEKEKHKTTSNKMLKKTTAFLTLSS